MTAVQVPSRAKLLKSKVSLPRNHKLVPREDRPRRVTPSGYTQEMLQTTEERLANTSEMHPPRILELLDMSETTHHKLSLVDMDQALFQPYPSELVFQNFTPPHTYQLPLLLFNNDKVSRQVKVVLEASQYFHVVGPEEAGSKVAPGMATTFTVFFTPQENKDYLHRLICVTERERFEVPIRAIGPRAILDFRDQLHLPACPVKGSTQRTQLVRNIGNSQAKFQLCTQSPFSVTPSVGTLGVGESMQVTVDFRPRTVGDHMQELLLHYHTGEDVHIELYGACEELSVCLEPDSVLLKKTYISLANTRAVSLANTSDVPLRYCWKIWPSQQEEDMHSLREMCGLQQEEEEGRQRLLSECESDPAAIHRLPLLFRGFRERRRQAAEDRLLALAHSCITVEPAEGEIWPNTTAQFNIVFKPQEAKLYQQTIYCDVTGRESRLPLTIKGEGMGPKLQLSYNLMDVQNVFIGDKNCYEVLVSNSGLIDAPFKLSSPSTTCGNCFSFSPEEGIVPPGACQVLQVTFHSCILGTFSEDLLLTVTGQPQPLTLTFRGCVIGPTFHFDVLELNFGDVAFGFPQTLTCTLFNTSLVPMTFALRALGDGSGPLSVASDKQVSELTRNQWQGSAARDPRARPVEFTLSPASGTVRAMSDVTIQVTLCSNTVKRYRLAVVVDVDGVGEEVMTLPLNARCVVPEVVVETPVLDFQRCFLGHPYEQRARLTNTSTLPACYGVLDQEYEERPSLLFGSSLPRGVIPPQSSVEVPLFLLAKAVGRLQHSALIVVFGSAKPPLEVALSCIGQGPTVHVQSPQLDFGRILVLTDVTRALHLLNQSPVPACFTARLVQRGSLWRVEPSEGEVPPEGQFELRLVAHLRDMLQFQDKLEVAVQDSQTHTVLLSATGTGTTIVSDRPFGPSLDLGTHFSHGPCQYHFRLTNQGQRLHRMYWATDSSPLFPCRGSLPSIRGPKGENGSGRTFLPSISNNRRGDVRGRGSLVSSTREKPVFSLSPSRVELFPGCSVDMVLTGSSDSPKVVRESLVCCGIVGLQGCYERIMTVDVTCRFVAPVLSVSPKQLNFYIEKVPGKSLVPLYEKLVLKNISSLSLSMDLSLVEPFSLCNARGDTTSATTKAMVLDDGMEADLWICFNPACCKNLMSRVVDEFLQVCYHGHPQQDMVGLHGEIHFPNLHFSSTNLDFGCVLNHTETQRELTITNCSPLPVCYRWTFLVDQKQGTIRESKVPKMSLEEEEEEEEEGGEDEGDNDLENETEVSPREPSLAVSGPGLFPDAQTSMRCPARLEEVFDVLPIYGQLQPGEQQLATFTFYGHAHISRQVVARCHVTEGPTYDITLRGEASEITYSLDSTVIDLGQQLFDRMAEAEVTLRNDGKVGFRFAVVPLQEEEEEEGEEGEGEAREEAGGPRPDRRQEKEQEELTAEPRPAQPVIIPAAGYVEAGEEQRLRVIYLPGVPEVFEKRLQLQVAFLPPQDITLTGEGVFPRVCLDLPRHLPDERYSEVLEQARVAVETDRVREETLSRPNSAGGTTPGDNCILTYEELLHMEVERRLIKDNAVAVTSSLLELQDLPGSSRKWHKLSRFLLPEYVLDFGYVIHGKVLSHTVKVTNPGPVAVSFHANRKPLTGTGFSIEFERVKNLPCGETHTFTVKFDPQGANLPMGDISIIMPIQVSGGPTVQVRLCAVVTTPGITVSMDTLQFDSVQCGMCQVMTIQLFNHETVPCCWSIAEDVKPCKKVDKFLPLHQRKKVSQEQRPPPVVFEMVPSTGVLHPKDRVNVQVKFTPTEGRAYSRQFVVCVADSTQRVLIAVQGQGEEAQLEFCPSELELGPCLPLSAGDEAEVIVRNPCPFPIEFYSLEFDTQYREEEKILRLTQGYDEHNVLLLPPRAPGDTLPPELLDHYKDHCSQLVDDELKAGLSKEEASSEKAGIPKEDDRPSQNIDHPQEEAVTPVSKEGTPQSTTLEQSKLKVTRESSRESLGQLEMTPVSRAIARHMGVDLSPEGLAARNRRGIALVVHGAPLTGKSSTAAALAHHYGGACLSVDAVVTEVLTNGTSPVSLTARQLYDRAAAEHAQKKAEEAAQASQDTPGPADPESVSPAVVRAEVDGAPVEDSGRSDDSEAPQRTEDAPANMSQEGQKQLDVILNQIGDVATLNHLLSEQLLVDILAERLQLSDCHRGVVIDGLDSVYTQSVASTLQVVLKAFNNREHIYVVNLSDSYPALKAREAAQREAEEALQREAADREEQWLQELDEEEYDALPEEEKERILQRHLEQLQQHKRTRELERIMREQEEKKQQEELERLREEEELKKKSKKGGKRDSKDEVSGKKSLQGGKQSTATLDGRRMSLCNNSKESPVEPRERRYSTEVIQNKEADEVQKRTKETNGPQAESPQPTKELEGRTSGEDELLSRFNTYEQNQIQVGHILQYWDRDQGILLVPLLTDEAALPAEDILPEKQTPVGKRTKKEREKERLEKEKQKADMADAKTVSQMLLPGEGGMAGVKEPPQDTIPHIVVSVTEKGYPSAKELLKGSALPSQEEVLDALGLGPGGPPVPPPVTFSVVPFPKKRAEPGGQLTCDCFTFLVPSGLDEDEKKDAEADGQASPIKEEVAATPSKGRMKKDSAATKDKDKRDRESQRSKRRTSAKRGKDLSHSPSLSSATPLSDGSKQGHTQSERSQKLTTFRWVVPANSEVVLKIEFHSDSQATFAQTFNFELLGTKRRYQLFCRGICTYPSICSRYTTLFALTQKVPQVKGELQKAYVVKPGYFEFGPLLCGKTRDKYKERKYPENAERLVIHNNSALEAEVQFRFQHDTKAVTYLLDPPTMTLKPDQKQELTVWAYPTSVGQIEDSVVCCIKDNPELVIIRLSCWGVRPEVELDRKQLHFDKILLHRQDSRTVTLYNKTALPAFWRLRGVEELGDEFSVSQDQGTIPPNSSYPLHFHFGPIRAINLKKTVRLEVSDVNNILGVMHTENLQITYEAYDIALHINGPKDGYLDFGTIKVFEEAKLCLSLKNHGKYEIAYKFMLERTDPSQPNLASIFTVSPECGTLLPADRPTAVQLLFRHNKEILLRDQPVLRCQVIEPGFGDGGETVAIIPIKVSVQSLFSKYKITPASDINFSSLVYGCRKTQTFTIENCGDFDIRFTICRMVKDLLPVPPGRPGALGPSKRMSRDSVLGKPTPLGSKMRRDSIQKDIGIIQNRLTTGVFTVSPCTGTLLPGSQQVVTVECVAEQLGNWNEGLVIDISDRDPLDQPEGIPYRLVAEVCTPGIASDFGSVFEEHHVCRSSNLLSSEQFRDAEGIYVLDENKFIFNNVLVGRTARARFKLTNNSKVPCLLSLGLKPVGNKQSRTADVFDLSTTRLCIPSQSHSFAVVTFTPQTMQLYHAVFEATLEGATSMTPTFKSKVLGFDLIGEGNLPTVCVVRPSLRNSRGDPMLQFRRVLVGRKHTLPLVLRNDGNVPAQVQMDMLDKQGVFSLRAAPSNTCSSVHCTQLEGSTDSGCQLAHRALLRLNVGQQAEFLLGFCSGQPVSVKAKMSLQVENSQYSNTVVQLAGEAYRDVVSLDRVDRARRDREQEQEEEGDYEVLDFGDCHVDRPYQECFTMTNHSSDQVLRFEWPPAGPHVSFSPQVGHLHAGSSKEVTVNFSSNQPVTLTSQPMRCKLCQVEFQQPLEQVADWDDRQRTVRWLSTSKQAAGAQPHQPHKNKVIKMDPEPCCSVVEGSQRELELRVSAVCDYGKVSCNTDSISFKDTMLYQTRLCQLQLVNEGTVKLDYSWQVLMDPNSKSINSDLGDVSPSSRPGSGAAGVVAAARPSSALASVMSVLMGNPELPPFSVEPNFGAMEPGVAQTFTIRFSPLEVARFQGRLVCSIPNLQDGDPVPCVSACGRSLLPHCHFDLEDSDYITGNRRNPDFRVPLDPNTRVIEFNSVGLSASVPRRFSVLNPTNKPYSFQWRCKDSDPGLFRCLTPSGTILPGKKVEVCLEYAAEQLGVVESLWSFTIETLSLSVPFVWVGNCREPLVYLSRAHLDMGDLLVGHRVEQTVCIVNGEEKPFHFSVLQSSLHCGDQQHSLELQPTTGTVAPKDRVPLSLSFTPRREGCVSFKLVLKVKGKSEPLALHIKADGYSMNACVQVERADGGLQEISPNRLDTLDFGKVVLAEQSTCTLLVSNLGRFSLEVTFDLAGPQELLRHLEAKPQAATVEVGKQLRWSLFFCSRNTCNLRDVRLSIKVKHGPTFTFAIKGRAAAPGLQFSCTKHNFGKCFIYRPGMMPASQTLVISNKGETGISVQCLFRNTSYLEVGFQEHTLSPGGMIEVPVTFYPRESRRYHEKITFVLNSCAEQVVDILGQGIEMKLHVEDPSQRKLKLGSLLLGQKVKKQVALVNSSTSDLTFTLLLNTHAQLDPRDLTVSPASELTLRASGGRCVVDIQFSPRQHTAPFTAELQAECAGLLLPLLTVHGCCQGVEVQLDRDYVAFGAVVQRCQAKKKIIMMNTGDIGAKFHWEIECFPPEVSIAPAKGYICPGMEVPFDVTFAPMELSGDTRYENLACFIEGFSTPVTLTLMGSCITPSTTKEVVMFVCPVRGSHVQTLTMSNPTNQRLSLKPVIEGEQWSAAPSLILEPLQNKTYEITYQPLTMAAEAKKHLGSVFFSFPDGTGMLYSLQGTAEPPKAEATITRELPAKTHHTEVLPVQNWLTKQQRFRVVIETLKPERTDSTLTLKGLEYIDIPALAKRDYKMAFFTYREGQFNTKVTFRNEASGEYLFYNVMFKVTSPGVLSTVELVTTVRLTASASVQVENPLATITSLTTECKCSDISVPAQHTVPGQSKGTLSFEYQPLHAGESSARLSLYNNELGYFHYELLLRALPPLPGKPIHFHTPLGSSHSAPAKFINYSRTRAEYSCKTDCPDFIVDKSVFASPGFQAGSEASVEICYEPHQLGEVRGQLTLFSAVGGEYVFPLHGTCLPPKAQGPFNIKVGSSITIPFKNVFLQTTVFSFQVDNPCFTVKGADTIRPKKTHNILVAFEPPQTGSQGPCFGKLIISSQLSEGHTKPCSWLFYLKGYCPETGLKERQSSL